MTFRFAEPLFAGLLFLLPVLAWFFWRVADRGRYRFSSLLLWKAGEGQSFRERSNWMDGLFWLLGLALLILGAMQPEWGRQITEQSQAGVAIVLAVDVSRSMAALDFEIDGQRQDRLTVTKKVMRHFIEKRPYDAIGMVVFGELAFTQCPLTTDHHILDSFIERLRIGMAGDGTAIGDGLAIALKRLQASAALSKVVVLMSDGVNNAGRLKPLQAAQFAEDLGSRVYTIGVGTKGKVPFPEETPWGPRIVMAELDFDEDSLQQVATLASGRYWNASNTEELLAIYDEIDRLEKTEIKVKAFAEYHELYPTLVIPGFVLLVLFPLVRFGVFKRWMGG